MPISIICCICIIFCVILAVIQTSFYKLNEMGSNKCYSFVIEILESAYFLKPLSLIYNH